ncbi:hypothetical protein SDC9_198838 [bioreactor metagenome]|uniref:Uncharacterized protein n=1 Tax=bioreactor metagenome TaxID=1076179 RepID=A0A645IJN0_9ZZZZ
MAPSGKAGDFAGNTVTDQAALLFEIDIELLKQPDRFGPQPGMDLKHIRALPCPQRFAQFLRERKNGVEDGPFRERDSRLFPGAPVTVQIHFGPDACGAPEGTPSFLKKAFPFLITLFGVID